MNARYVGTCLLVPAAFAFGCENDQAKSAAAAKKHVQELVKTAKADVTEVRDGLPKGAKRLERLYKKETPPTEDLKAVRWGLLRAREEVQDLRVAKSTFFALATPKGSVLRNDQEQDQMAGKNIFRHFPALKTASQGKYVETQGSMPEAAGVKGGDGQWVAASPVKVDNEVVGVYVTGWSWSAYAYRLENGLKSLVRDELKDQRAKMPLVYVYVLVGKGVHGAPVSPMVNAKAIAKQDAFAKTAGGKIFSTQLEITGRGFGLAVARAPSLGEQVAIAILRSET